MNKGKAYEVKEWFANKIANEVMHDIMMCEVFAVMKETEKAAYVMLNLGCDKRKCTWIPKSAMIEKEVGVQENGQTLYETIFVEDYDECVKKFSEHWNNFR